jgi:drug/metabolite transporter (DMT)-like permease
MRPYGTPRASGPAAATPDLPRASLIGILCALAGSVVISGNDMAIKHLSGDYALHQVILIRALIGMVVLAVVIVGGRTSFRQLLTPRPGAHMVRVGFVLVSNVTYFLGLSVLPLADAVAVAFVSPLIVTLLSVVVLGEPVGPRRWAAVAVGLVGVVVMLRPGTGAFQPAALLVLVSAFCYAASHMMTRRMKDTESAVALSFYVQLGFILVSAAMGLTVGGGQMAGDGQGALGFLFRAWHWPPVADWPFFLATGLSVSIGGLLISQAYRLNEASVIAPFEYANMPMAIFWGAVMFGQWPDLTAAVGIALICGAGLYTLWRETRGRRG